jgi:MSHA biogenesis protein MshE
LLQTVFEEAIKMRASDIHIEPQDDNLRIRFRIDGALYVQATADLKIASSVALRLKLISGLDIAEKRLPQDGRFNFVARGQPVDVRISTMPTQNGESVVMRLLNQSGGLLSLDRLGMSISVLEKLRHAIHRANGMVLVTGPTGSGKTTTLYSILQSIYKAEKKIITIEDPVEYELAGVAQIPVRPARGFSFATGLRAILRQDPNVVMVGEIRDAETAEIAIRAALTGHQVFSTLHTNDSTGAVTRLIDMGIEPFLISSSLEGVLAQRLVRRICPTCRTKAPATSSVREKFAMLEGDFWIGAGCEECRGTGYRGRVGIFELLEITPALQELILQRRSSAELKATVRDSMLSLFDDGLRKAAAGITTLEEIVRVCSADAKE